MVSVDFFSVDFSPGDTIAMLDLKQSPLDTPIHEYYLAFRSRRVWAFFAASGDFSQYGSICIAGYLSDFQWYAIAKVHHLNDRPLVVAPQQQNSGDRG